MSSPPAGEVGQAMEALALRYLERRGLKLVARNYRGPRGEIDLIMREGPTFVFVEVRYRRHAGWGGGVESIDARKRQRLTLTALNFLLEREGTTERPCRFDVVAISPGSDQSPRIEWLPNAFEPE